VGAGDDAVLAGKADVVRGDLEARFVPWPNTARMPDSSSPSIEESVISGVRRLWHQSKIVVAPAWIWASAPTRLAM
jgi:hypothetical protein